MLAGGLPGFADFMTLHSQMGYKIDSDDVDLFIFVIRHAALQHIFFVASCGLFSKRLKAAARRPYL